MKTLIFSTIIIFAINYTYGQRIYPITKFDIPENVLRFGQERLLSVKNRGSLSFQKVSETVYYLGRKGRR